MFDRMIEIRPKGIEKILQHNTSGNVSLLQKIMSLMGNIAQERYFTMMRFYKDDTIFGLYVLRVVCLRHTSEYRFNN